MPKSPDKTTEAEFLYQQKDPKSILKEFGIDITVVAGVTPDMIKELKAKMRLRQGQQTSQNNNILYGNGDVQADPGVLDIQELELEQDDNGLYTGKVK